MADFGFQPHANEMQTALKASFDVDKKSLQRVIDAIESRAQACRVVISGATNFDVLPPNAGKGPATLACLERFGTGKTQLICAGDSANDVELLDVAHFGILVENADGDLRDAVDPRRTYFARRPYADGVLDGLQSWGVPLASSTESIRRRAG
jgi:hydroxymethylpyrimidine pyrophosphatase-like HAD family hydrolase